MQYCNPLLFTDTLKQQAFAAQTSLERLDLRDNRISTIESGAFDGLNQPKEIYLSGNRLSKMNSDVFQVIDCSIYASGISSVKNIYSREHRLYKNLTCLKISLQVFQQSPCNRSKI